jgi:hypothetical protein
VNRVSTTDLLFREVKCIGEEIEKKDPDNYEKVIPEDIRVGCCFVLNNPLLPPQKNPERALPEKKFLYG